MEEGGGRGGGENSFKTEADLSVRAVRAEIEFIQSKVPSNFSEKMRV